MEELEIFEETAKYIDEEPTKEKENNKKSIINVSENAYIVSDCLKRFKNPCRMLNVTDVMKDLNICETIAYKLFRREDFPSINIGKNHQVMLASYLLWKMNKRD